jgi:hypothetical protein
MEIYQDTQSLFAQLAAVPGAQGVKTLIENHDAWTHSETLAALKAAWTRLAAQPRDPALQTRIARQQKTLAPLLTRLSVSYASAG